MTAVLADFAGALGAEFSADRANRYLLWRIWDRSRPLLGIIMLNPSRADEGSDDPTTLQNANRARRAGYGGIVQGNLYSHIATDPRALKRADYPGRDRRNWEALDRIGRACPDILLAWGAHAVPVHGRETIAALREHVPAPRLLTLGIIGNGMPRHPLRVPSATPYMPWEDRG